METYLFSLPIKRSEISDLFLSTFLKNAVLQILPVQKQTWAGQQTRLKAFVTVGDYNGHAGLGDKCSKEVATATGRAIILASFPPSLRGDAAEGTRSASPTIFCAR